jgi:hypothetical protein
MAAPSFHLLETAMPIDETPSTSTEFSVGSTAPTRRTMLKGAAAAGIGVATAGVVADIMFAGPASAATTSSHGTDEVVAHVRDIRTGEIDIYSGTRQVSVRDRQLAARLARAAR